MFRAALILFVWLVASLPAVAQDADKPIQQLLQEHGEIIQKSSRKSIAPAIDALANSGLPDAQVVLERWQAKDMWFDKETGLFVFAAPAEGGDITLFDVAGNAEIGTASKRAYKQLKPNSGIRGMIASALVQFQLNAPEVETRARALSAIERDAKASHLPALQASIEKETNDALKARKMRLAQLLTIRFGEDDATRITAIEEFSGDLSVDLRAALNPLVQTKIAFAEALPDGAIPVEIGEDLSQDAAYQLLVDADRAPPRTDADTLKATLIANIEGDEIAGIKVATLNTDDARAAVYAVLAEQGDAQPLVTEGTMASALTDFVFYKTFVGAPVPVALAAQEALNNIDAKLALSQTADLALDGLSLASIYFLAAIGLAITFGVMGANSS